MKLYFETMVTTVTTLMIVSLVGFVGYSISNRSNISFWGRRSLFILAYSLVICCFAAARDGLDKTIQYTIDGSCNPGIFSLVRVPNIVGCVGAAIIIIAAIATPIAKSQHMREIWFYVMFGGVMLKIVVMVCSLTACGQQETETMTNTGNSIEQVVTSEDNSELATAEDGTSMTTDEIKKETVSWLSDKGNSEQVEFSNKLASVYDAYQKLLGPDAKELLEQAGCDDAAYPWSDAPVETIEAIVEVVQLPDEP